MISLLKKILIASTFVLFSCSCSKIFLTSDERNVADMMSSTVKIKATTRGTKYYIADKDGNKHDPELDISGWSGSGVIMENDLVLGKSLIMTAAHVVDDKATLELGIDENGPFFEQIAQITFEAELQNGTLCTLKPNVVDFEHDVATAVTDCIAGTAATLADSLPPPGGRISISGAPLGIKLPNAFIVVEGAFMGRYDFMRNYTTAPVVGGFSGSGAFYRGQVVGILNSVMTRYEHSGMIIDLQWCKQVLDDSANWRN